MMPYSFFISRPHFAQQKEARLAVHRGHRRRIPACALNPPDWTPAARERMLSWGAAAIYDILVDISSSTGRNAEEANGGSRSGNAKASASRLTDSNSCTLRHKVSS